MDHWTGVPEPDPKLGPNPERNRELAELGAGDVLVE
jgi:hypothetical protein